jgi:hypothetical protein
MWYSVAIDGAYRLPAPVHVMRLRRAALKIPAKSSVPPRSPLYKLRPLPTPSESTLPQLLIPLHFKSFISNTYEKTGRGPPRPDPKFVNSSLPPRHPSARATAPARHRSPKLVIPRESRDLLFYSGSRETDHGSRTTRVLCAPLCTLRLCVILFRFSLPCTNRLAIFTTHHSLFTTHSRLTAPPCSETDSD